MARPFQSEAIRENMAGSLARRPSIAIGSTAAPAPGQFQGRAKLPGACVIEIDRLVPDPDQPRKTFTEESIEQLADSFKVRGQLIPILVRWSPEANHYSIIDGERRYRAALLGGLTSLTAVDVSTASPEDVLEIQLVTNALREDVAPVEQARAWKRLMDAKGLTHRELASRLGYDHSTVTRSLGLLNLPESIQASVDAGEIKAQTGYELSRIEDPGEQANLAEVAKSGRLKRDELRERVAKAKVSKGRAGGPAKSKPSSTEITKKEWTFKAPDGSKVTISRRKAFTEAEALQTMESATQELRGRLAGRSSDAGSTGQGGEQAA